MNKETVGFLNLLVNFYFEEKQRVCIILRANLKNFL